ncbi:MAG: hypothetical protein R2883_00540 [Caldisericia bacterium]
MLTCTYEKGFIINVDDGWQFQIEIRVKDGYNKISFNATDSAGTEQKKQFLFMPILKAQLSLRLEKLRQQ